MSPSEPPDKARHRLRHRCTACCRTAQRRSSCPARRTDQRPHPPARPRRRPGPQAWRGGPQHQISRLLKGCDILPDDQRTGRAAGVACAASGTADVVDAIVIVTAVRHQASVVTSDPGGLARIADSVGVRIRLFPI